MVTRLATGYLPKDASEASIQRSHDFSTVDASGTPIQSPKVISSTEVVFTMPEKTSMIVFWVDEPVWVDSKTGVGAAQGFLIPANIIIPMDISAGKSLFFIRQSVDASLQFYIPKLM